MKEYTKEQKQAIGHRIAEILFLQPSCYQTEYQTEYGNKSAIGIFETIRSFAEMIRDGSIEGL